MSNIITESTHQDWVAQPSIKFKCQLKLILLEMYMNLICTLNLIEVFAT
jgi:hypothetical protein